MLFCTQQFLFFFAIVFTTYWIIPSRWRWVRVSLLIAASFFFYAYFSIWIACLVTASATLDWALAKGIYSARSRGLRKLPHRH